jgi:hypothetical protein
VTVFNLRNARLRTGEQLRSPSRCSSSRSCSAARNTSRPDPTPAELTITKATTGTVFQLSFRVTLSGRASAASPTRSLEQAVDAREYQATNPGGDDELVSPYVEADNLDLSSWARDASRSRCRTRSSAAPTAPASARSAAGI